MSYFRRGIGDDEEGPITDPSQVDDTINAGVVPPTRVPCSALPADSPWRRPGQPCADPSAGVLEFLKSLFPWKTGTQEPAPDTSASPPPSASSGVSPLLLLGGAAAVYYLVRSRKGS